MSIAGLRFSLVAPARISVFILVFGFYALECKSTFTDMKQGIAGISILISYRVSLMNPFLTVGALHTIVIKGDPFLTVGARNTIVFGN